MKHSDSQEVQLKPAFYLKGWVGWTILRHHDPDHFYGERLNEEIEASTLVEAVEKAKVRVDHFLKANKRFAPPTPKGSWERGFHFELTVSIWSKEYIQAHNGRAAQVAVPAIPATAARVEETNYL